jgi:hypothetical protein
LLTGKKLSFVVGEIHVKPIGSVSKKCVVLIGAVLSGLAARRQHHAGAPRPCFQPAAMDVNHPPSFVETPSKKL